LINRHCDGKPILIFCPTRRCEQPSQRCGISSHLKQLAKTRQTTSVKCIQKLRQKERDFHGQNHRRSRYLINRIALTASRASDRIQLNDVKLSEMTKVGVAVHHAGLDYNDRRSIEDGFRYEQTNGIKTTRKLNVIVSTSVRRRPLKCGMTDSARPWLLG
jgi:replicative superfamily II helicase